jgi:2-C-methyl-D-erythritol 4-phosphate cytidylyltransferase
MSPTTRAAASPSKHFAVVPAAGAGTRLGGPVPKQYLALGGRTLLQWSVDALLEAPWIETVLVVVTPGDTRASAVLPRSPRLRIEAVGGATRRDSVLAGLRVLRPWVRAGDWVLVHDAARPGLSLEALERLRRTLVDHAVGGLLAVPVADTVKVADAAGEVARTVPREGLWLAQTPQMFRHGLLLEALERFPDVTDEAAALEACGHAPRLVEGQRRNFKVTTAEDLAVMQALLA